MDENNQAPAEPEEGKHVAKARRGRNKTPKSQGADTPDTGTPAPADAGSQAAEPATGWISKLPEPFGRHTIDIGDGRRLRLLRSNRWQQSQIAFVAPDGEDPKPDAKYTRWLREHGWQWRGQDRAWTKQFDKNTEESRYARSNSDLADQMEFVELANLIRQDKGMEAVLPMSEQRSVGG